MMRAFAALSPSLSSLFAVARTEDHLEGDVIIHKGDLGSTFYVILEGVVLVTEASLGDGTDGEGGGGGDTASAGTQSPSSSMATRPPPATTAAVKALPKSSTKVKGGLRLKAGEWFGEIALLNDGKRTANVLADSSARLLVFDRESFEQVWGWGIYHIREREFPFEHGGGHIPH